MNRHEVVGKVGKFNLCSRPERLTSHAGVVLLQDFARRRGVAQVRDDELQVKTRERGYPESAAVGSLARQPYPGRDLPERLGGAARRPGDARGAGGRGKFWPRRPRANSCASSPAAPGATCRG